MARHTRHKSRLGACEGKGFVTDSKEQCRPSIELVYNDTHSSDVGELVCAEGKRMMLEKDCNHCCTHCSHCCIHCRHPILTMLKVALEFL